MKAEEFDKRFDNNEDIADFLDLTRARRPDEKQKSVNIDFPLWMIRSLDKEARRLGVNRQDIIKFWIADKLRNTVSAKSA